MENQCCPNLENCPMFKQFKLHRTTEYLMERYCNDNYKNCVRKKLKDSGKEVPDTLMPNGDTIPH